MLTSSCALPHCPGFLPLGAQDGEELAGFMKYAVALHRAHLMLSTLVQPAADSTRRGALKGQELMEAHQRCVCVVGVVGREAEVTSVK